MSAGTDQEAEARMSYTRFFLFVGMYMAGLTVWTPLYLVWPRCYPGTNWLQSVAIRWQLVRFIWGKYVFRQSSTLLLEWWYCRRRR